MYQAPAALKGGTVQIADCINRSEASNFTAKKNYVDSSTSTEEEEQLLSRHYTGHGVNQPREVHVPGPDVEMIDKDIENNCPRIIKAFSLNESHCRFLQDEDFQPQQEYPGMAGSANLNGFVYHGNAMATCNGDGINADLGVNAASTEMELKQLLHRGEHAVKTEPPEELSFFYAHSQNVNTDELNGSAHSAQNQGAGSTCDGRDRHAEVGINVSSQMEQGQCFQQEYTVKTEPLKPSASFFCAHSKDSKTSESGSNDLEDNEECSTREGLVSGNSEPFKEGTLPSFNDKNLIFGINCESDGKELTLKYGCTEEKGTQYLVEDTGLCPVVVNTLSVSSNTAPKFGVTKEREINAHFECRGRPLSSDSNLSSNIPASQEDSPVGIVRPFNTFPCKQNIESVKGESNHGIATRYQSNSRYTIEYFPSAEPEVASPLSVFHFPADRWPSKPVDVREDKILKLKQLLEKQEKELERVRSQRGTVNEGCQRTDKQDQDQDITCELPLSHDEDRVKEDENVQKPSDPVAGLHELSNVHELKKKKSSSPRKRTKVTNYRSAMSKIIHAEMAKQNRSGKGKKCHAYLDSTGAVVFGRKESKRTSAVSTPGLEKLIFRLRQSLSKQKEVSKNKVKSKSLSRACKSPTKEGQKWKKDNLCPDSRIDNEIHPCRDDPCNVRKSAAGKLSLLQSDAKEKVDKQVYSLLGSKLEKNPPVKDHAKPRSEQEEFLAIFGLACKTPDMVAKRFTVCYGARRRLLDHEIQPTDCRGLFLGSGFEYRENNGWFITA